MPFRSEKQRRFMWAKHPEIAQRWTKEYGSAIKNSGYQTALKNKLKEKLHGQK